MISRHPEDVTEMGNRWLDSMLDVSAKLQIEYSAERTPTDPDQFHEWIASLDKSEHARRALELQAEMIDSPVLGTIINNMEWAAIEVTGATHPLLTSDRPVARVGALTIRDALIVLPISPNSFFVAMNDAIHGNFINQLEVSVKVRDLNRAVVERAVRFVYGPDDVQLTFVQRYMGTGQLPSRFTQPPRPTGRHNDLQTGQAWGVPSPDSDYDCRFVFVRPACRRQAGTAGHRPDAGHLCCRRALACGRRSLCSERWGCRVPGGLAEPRAKFPRRAISLSPMAGTAEPARVELP